MFSKLVFKNVTKSVRDYTIYFLTLMFGVCLFYLFNSIDAQTAMLEISKSQEDVLKVLTEVIGYVSVFISVVLGFLVVYANGFLMKRRKKELGVYMTLGMPKGKISAIILLETLLIGLFSLAAGLVAGVFLSQGMSVVTAKLFEANLSRFIFTFSPSAFWKTLLYFGVMFLVVMIFNMISVSHLKLIDLLSAGRKNQRLRIGRLWVSVVLFFASVGCLAVAYYLIEKNGLFRITPEFLASLSLGTAGTLLFFVSLSGFLLRVVKTNRKLYFKNLNMFVLRQFNSKINTTFVSVSVICIMLLVTIGTLSTGLSMSSALSKELKGGTPYDVSVLSYQQKAADIQKGLEKNHLNLSQWSNGYAQIYRYDSGVLYHTFLTKENWPEGMGSYDRANGKMTLSAISLSDFNKLEKLQGKPALALKNDQYAINCSYNDLVPVYSGLLASGKKIAIHGKTLAAGISSVKSECFQNSGGLNDIGTLILPDGILSGMSPLESVLNLNYRPGVEQSQFLSKLNAAKSGNPIFDEVRSREQLRQEASGNTVMVSYLTLYIGLVFLIAAAAVLALQQLSEASDNAERYGLLRKLGAEEGMVNRALLIQIALYFFLPLSLAIVHSIVGIHVANQVIMQVGHMDVLRNVVTTAVIFLVIYGAYFLATYFGCRSMIRQREIYHRTE